MADLESLLGGMLDGDGQDVTPYLVRALRNKEALGEAAMMAPLLAPQAKATLEGARGDLGDLMKDDMAQRREQANERAIVLRQTLGSRAGTPVPPISEDVMAQLETFGVTRPMSSPLTLAQGQQLLRDLTQKFTTKAREAQDPEVQAEKAAKRANAAKQARVLDLTIKEKEAAASGGKVADPAKLRQEFSGTQVVKDTEALATALQKLESLQPTAAGDMGAIFSYMKILDPGSTVREGEYASARNATGVPSRIVNLYNSTVDGQLLTPEQRKDFKQAARDLFKGQKARYDATAAEYRRLAGDRAGDVVLDRGFDALIKDAAPASAAPAGKPDAKTRAAELMKSMSRADALKKLKEEGY